MKTRPLSCGLLKSCTFVVLALLMLFCSFSAARVVDADAKPVVKPAAFAVLSDDTNSGWLNSAISDGTEVNTFAGLLASGIALNVQRRPPSGQIGTICVAIPKCPDCVNGGNVCRSVQQFYPGATYFLGARKDMVRRCKEANGLDYCGGSYGCVRQKNWTPREADRHRARYGGGCYKQCDTAVSCAFQGR